MTEYPLTLIEIVSWYRSKQALLREPGCSVVDIRERTDQLPAAAADFTGRNTMGRINGWVSGEFDFEGVRVSDGKDIFWRHVSVSSLGALESTYADFLRSLQNGDEVEVTNLQDA